MLTFARRRSIIPLGFAMNPSDSMLARSADH